ncbi:MAG: LTA synthase family protein [Gammaproteobacteria bacterium]
MVIAQVRKPRSRLYLAISWVLQALPASVAGMACLRIAELAAAQASWSILPDVIGNDLATLLRYGWLAAVLALPCGFLASYRARAVGVGALWSVLLLVHALLIQYHITTGVPLGADLFAYSAQEVATTARGGAISPITLAGLAAALLVCWTLLWIKVRRQEAPVSPLSIGAGVLGLLLAPLFVPPAPAAQGHTLALNKARFFLDDSLRYAWAGQDMERAAPASAVLDPAHPFLHEEHTPDTLGPLLRLDTSARPNIVLIIVEGLGRSFSGPGARLGSFTPFLDELSTRSVYFENFLSAQGRTFAVLPSILGSLPFAANGFAALGERMPHASLTGTLAKNGYALRFYTGSNLSFDNEGQYLQRAGVQQLISEKDFPPGPRRSTEWGYADGDLIDLVAAREARAPAAPYATIIQTGSMHTPFEFPGKARYLARVDQHLDKLGIAPGAREPYQRQKDIYASILYADDALRRYFDAARTLPTYANTIFLITGDHRLPEIPMETRLERYHVPLIVYSPLLKAPLSVKSISSHFDIAPSLLALLSNRYGMATPARVTWLGTGLDLEPTFRNVHVIPLKQTKTELSDFLSGTAYLAQDRLYSVTDGMQAEPLDSAGARAQVARQFGAFMAANSALIRSGTLAPPQALAIERPYAAAGRSLVAAELASQASDLFVDGARVEQAAGGVVRLNARFSNRARQATPAFVPLLVLTDDKGRELGEAYGRAVTLQPSGSMQVELSLARPALAAGTYFLSMIPSDPETGKPVGAGQYHVPFTR